MKKLVMLEQPDRGLKLVSNVALSAKRFTRWKNKYEKKENERYDLALLLTRCVCIAINQGTYPSLYGHTNNNVYHRKILM